MLCWRSTLKGSPQPFAGTKMLLVFCASIIYGAVMDCVHVDIGVRIRELDIDLVKKSGRRLGNRRLPAVLSVSAELGNWNCVDCGTSLSPWLCLFCGLIHCGRYVNQDGLRHFHESPDHRVCMDCQNYAVFCYSCDEFVGTDTKDGKIQAIRRSLQHFNNLRLGDHTYSSPKHTASTAWKRSADVGLEGGTEAKLPRTRSRSTRKVQETTDLLALRGLRNLGNTCFMNAVLQSLNNIDDFSSELTKLPELDVGPAMGERTGIRTRRSLPEQVWMAEELRRVLRALQTADSAAISPDKLFSVVWKLVPRFRGFQQQDAHEFLRCILDRLQSELKTLKSTQRSAQAANLVSSVFEGWLQSQVTCLSCCFSSKKQDPFLDLSLDIPTSDAGPVRLLDCLHRFFGEEVLGQTEQFMCDTCRKKRPSVKQFFLRQVPNVLCLHLKRFRWTHSGQKLDDFVHFPIKGLDLAPFLLTSGRKTRGLNHSSAKYDLTAIVVHHGSGAGGGHYTAFALRGKHWYHYNDATVQESTETSVGQQKAYILFYLRRKSPRP